jgi:AcrR family transcriptional regulator
LKEAARSRVKESGPRGFSLNEAARRAGVSASAPYRHFADKDALLADLALDGNHLLTAYLRSAARRRRTPLEGLIAIGVAYVRFARLHRDYFDVMFYSGIDKPSYPNLLGSAQESFGVGADLARHVTDDAAKQHDMAFATWTIAHGVTVLANERALEYRGGGGNARSNRSPAPYGVALRHRQ